MCHRKHRYETCPDRVVMKDMPCKCIFAVVAKMLHSCKNQRLQNERKLSIKVIVASLFSISLIEPGPVITEFERKVYEEGLKTDLTKADKVTADMFTNIYLKNYKQIFETFGQSPEDIAEVDIKKFFLFCCVLFCQRFKSLFCPPAHPQDHHHGKPTVPPPDKHALHPHDHTEIRRPQRRPPHRHFL